jgi:hypothetical protein
MRHSLLQKTSIFLLCLVTSICFIRCEKETDSTTNTGSGSGGGSGSSSTGNATFWVASDLGCGTITVSVNGQSKTISSFYSTSPACGASGCANFTLAPGTYNYSASCSGKTWSNSITVTAGGCSKMQLTSTNNSGGGTGGTGGGTGGTGGGTGGTGGGTGGTGGGSGGSSGGGSGGSCTDMSSSVTAQGTWINNCGSGGNNDLSVKVTNKASKALYIRIIFKKKDGSFDCRGVSVAAGGTGTQSACNVSEYRYQAILDSEFGNSCMGACQF